MNEFLKKLPLYPVFLYLRTKSFDNEKLLTQLSKKGHALEKAISKNTGKKLYFLEVKWLLDEYQKRKFEPNQITAWAWDLLYKAKFSLSTFKKEKISFKETGSNFEKIVKERRSIRSWGQEAVKREEIVEALDWAKWAPSSCNRQAWKFLILEKKEDKEFLQILNSQPFYQKAPLVIVALANVNEYNRGEMNYLFLDMGAIIQNLLLALDSKGLGACWLGIKQIEENFKEFRRRFGIEEIYLPVSLIAIGQPAEAPFPPARKETKDLIFPKEV